MHDGTQRPVVGTIGASRTGMHRRSFFKSAGVLHQVLVVWELWLR